MMRSGAIALSLALGCSAYEPALLHTHGETGPQSISAERCGDGQLDEDELCDTGIAAGLPGACPSTCGEGSECEFRTVAGRNCQQECIVIAITMWRDNDGCCPAGADSGDDNDCARCGNGAIDPGETCDPIETCERRDECKSDNRCLVVRYAGDPAECNARCTLTTIEGCRNGDNCCPSGCDAANDDDCSGECGDGIVSKGAGETCEVGGTPDCPQTCDDQQPCTMDIQTGNRRTCNMACSHRPVFLPVPGDGCCAPGGFARQDSDCGSVCGNGIGEVGEECDGGPQCGEDCRLLSLEAQCLNTLARDQCNSCICANCTAETLDCYASPEPERDRHCVAVVDCARVNDCKGDACYCGTSFACGAPNGACVDAVQAAVDSSDGATVDRRSDDPAYGVLPAKTLGTCRLEQCAEACGLTP
jgi:hypothetical protein